MIKPKALKKGDTIGLVSPSGPISEKSLKTAEKLLANLGYKTKAGKHALASYGYLAGSDEERAEDINAAFADDEVDAIICNKGGYGTPRILDRIDYELVKSHPKLFIGYSDITGLHVAFNTMCDLVTIQGPMPITDGCFSGEQPYSFNSLMKTITDPEPIGSLCNPKGYPLQKLNGGKAKGTLIGGNLSLVVATIGSPYEINVKDRILFLEDIGEDPYRIDRMLTQLRLAGKFDECAGVLLGTWVECESKMYGNNTLSLDQIFSDVVAPCGKPVICNVMSGHCSPKMTLPFGAEAVMDADNLTLEVTESAVI